MKKLALAMLQTIAAMNPEGFTVDKNTFDPITSGYSVAVAETQNSFGSSGAAKVVKFAENNAKISGFGGWYNNKNGKYYYDAIIIVSDLETAIRLGRENGQIAIFDLNNMQEIDLS